jgi:dienelactone hydrolase
VYLDAEGNTHPVHTRRDWQKRRSQILENMQLVMGKLPGTERLVPHAMQILEEERFPRYIRRKITFATEPGDRVPAYLLIPSGIHGKAPAMLCLHQTVDLGKGEPAGIGGNANLHYARELVERGYVTLAPDYPRFGDYNIDPYAMGYASATMKGIWNHIRGVDLLQSLPQVDPRRIGVIGHSLGGHNALFLAAFDQRIKAVVTSCGFTSFAKYYHGDLTGWSHQGYMPRIATEFAKDPARMPFDFSEVLGVLAPRAVFINAPLHDDNFEVSGVKDCIAAAMPVYSLFKAVHRLVAMHPDCGHDFPPEVRAQAYRFLDANLR